MTEPAPVYATPPHPDALPARAMNLARRALDRVLGRPQTVQERRR